MSAPRIDHIGIVVDELEPAIAAMARMLPGAPLRRRSVPDAGLEVAEFHAENLIVELLRYTDRGDGFGRSVMGPAPGVNHLSLSVPDLDDTCARLEADGIRVTSRTDGLAWTDREDTLGMHIQWVSRALLP